jgi:hypothetical protein
MRLSTIFYSLDSVFSLIKRLSQILVMLLFFLNIIRVFSGIIFAVFASNYIMLSSGCSTWSSFRKFTNFSLWSVGSPHFSISPNHLIFKSVLLRTLTWLFDGKIHLWETELPYPNYHLANKEWSLPHKANTVREPRTNFQWNFRNTFLYPHNLWYGPFWYSSCKWKISSSRKSNKGKIPNKFYGVDVFSGKIW